MAKAALLMMLMLATADVISGYDHAETMPAPEESTETMPAREESTGSMPDGHTHEEPMPPPMMPCECAHVYFWEGMYHSGCLQDTATEQYWCMTAVGTHCSNAMPSTVMPGMHWMECPEQDWKHDTAWDLTTFEDGGMQRMIGMKEDMKHAKMTRTADSRTHLGVHYTKETGTVFEWKGKAARNTTYHKLNVSTVEKTLKKNMYTLKAGMQKDDYVDQKWRRHGKPGHMMTHTWLNAGQQNDYTLHGMDEGTDCSFWQKLLGYDADCVPGAHMSQGRDGRRLSSMFV